MGGAVEERSVSKDEIQAGIQLRGGADHNRRHRYPAPARFQLGIKIIGNVDGTKTSTLTAPSDGAGRASDLCRPKGVGMVAFAASGFNVQKNTPSTIDWSRWQQYDQALNPNGPPAGTATGEPKQAPLTAAALAKLAVTTP